MPILPNIEYYIKNVASNMYLTVEHRSMEIQARLVQKTQNRNEGNSNVWVVHRVNWEVNLVVNRMSNLGVSLDRNRSIARTFAVQDVPVGEEKHAKCTWLLKEVSPDQYTIQNGVSRLYLIPMNIEVESSPIWVYNTNPGDFPASHKWEFITKQQPPPTLDPIIKMPTAAQVLDNCRIFFYDAVIGQTSLSRLVGMMYIPSFMVNDESKTDGDIYYVLKRFCYWTCKHVLEHDGSVARIRQLVTLGGMPYADRKSVKRVLGLYFSANNNLYFYDDSIILCSRAFLKQLQVKQIRQKDADADKYNEQHDLNFPLGHHLRDTLWFGTNRYELSNSAGNIVLRWTVIDNSIRLYERRRFFGGVWELLNPPHHRGRILAPPPGSPKYGPLPPPP